MSRAFAVYRIFVFDGGDNRFTTGRTEDWEEKWVASFDTENEAKNYIRKECLSTTDILNYLIALPKEKWPQFIDEFCFTNEIYIPYRRLSIGRTNKQKLKIALQKNSINLIPSSQKIISK
jgi:hypothetical protein